MNKKWIGIFCKGVVLAVAGAVPLTANAATGRTAGTGAVGQGGAASYSIPIVVPPGTRGMTPSLSLSYSSNSDNGLVGVGWGIGGLSAIRRCGSTLAQDGLVREVRRDYSDRFCLNGSKLRLTSGVYGNPGATYQTEIADFSVVTSSGTAGNGPASFSVQDRNGVLYEYGGTADSRIEIGAYAEVRTWALNRVTDTAGNSMTFTYTEDTTNGSYRIARVNYTSNSVQGLAAAYEVEFVYETKSTSEMDVAYIAGGFIREVTRLDRVDVKYNTSVVRRYELTYEGSLSSTSKSRLASLQECAGSPLDCLPSTTFVYQNGTVGLTSETNTSASVPSTSWTIDVNGDGRDDLVYSSSSGSGTWMVMLANASGGFNTPINTGIANTGHAGSTPIDYNADGLMDLLVPYSGSTWWVLSGNNSGSGLSAPSNTGTPATVTGNEVRAFDVNGDGLDDLVWGQGLGTYGSSAVNYRLRELSGSFSSTILGLAGVGPDETFATGVFGASGNSTRTRIPDFNGDGRGDLLIRRTFRLFNEETGQYQYFRSLQVMCTGSWGSNVPNVPASAAPYFGDFNGDGKTDFFFLNQTGSYVAHFSTGTGMTGAQTITPLSSYGQIAILDYDGDGYDDVLMAASGTWRLFRSTGIGFLAPVNTGLAATSTQTAVSDINGDGLTDLGGVISGSWQFRTHAGAYPDLLQTATDGLANSITFNYAPLTSANYSKYSDAVFPEQDYVGPMYVVNSFTASNGIGGTYTNSFWYYGARTHLQGRGLEGFYAKRTTDSRNGLYSYQYYRRDFPFTGAVFQDDLYQSDGSTLIRRLQQNFTYTTLESGANSQRYFPYPSSSTELQYEVGGSKNGQLITTTATSYTFDTSGNATNVATTVTDNDSTSPYSGQQWSSTTVSTISPQPGCLGLPTQVTVTNTAPGVPSLTRTTGYTPNYSFCRMSQVVIEPSSATYRVTRAIGYDGFGNVNSETVTGIGMADRVTTTGWGATGQFPVSVTNALNHTSQLGYNYALGVNTSVTDANNLTVTWDYDGFGRRTSEVRPDGTSTTTDYTTCSAGSCINSNHRTTVTQTIRNVGGSTLTDQFTYLDQLERPIATSQRLMSGAYNLTQTRYDALGRAYENSVPCAASSCTTYWSTNYYDAVNRVTLQRRPISASNATLQSTAIAYLGRTTTITDAQNKVTTRISTVAGTLGRSQDHNGYYQAFTYDAFGSLIAVNDSLSNALLSATYDYGLSAFQRTTSDMDLGTRAYTYNALGEVTAGSDGKGQSFSATFDALSRPLTRTEAEGTTTWTWGTSAASYNRGKLQSVSSPGYSESFAYDNRSRLSNRQIVSDASYAYDYTYNATTGLPETMTYPVSTSSYRLQLQYVYQNGALRQVRDNVAGTTFWQADSTNARGQVTQETLGNGVVTGRTFDALTGWISTIQSGVSGGAALQNESYLFDLVGNVTQRQNNNLGLTENFYYDHLYRLDYSTLNSVTNLDMNYDAMGNITSRSDIAGGATWTYHATKRHAVTQAGSASYTYSYDANGNAQTRNGHTITWTSYNYPTVINGPGKTMTFSYGPVRQRYRQVYNNGSTTETTQYVGGSLEKVTGADGVTDWRHYVAAAGKMVAVLSRQSNGTNTTRYTLEDHQGSIAQIADSSGAQYVSESFTAFGARRDAATWSGACNCPDLAKMKSVTRRGYTGHEAIGGVSMGLTHMNGRVHDAVTGRFLSPDPLTTDAASTQGWNRYSYALNNPMTLVDPSGFSNRDRPNTRPQNGDRGSFFAANGMLSPQEEAAYERGVTNWLNTWSSAIQQAGMAPISGYSGRGWFEATAMQGFRGPGGTITPQTPRTWVRVSGEERTVTEGENLVPANQQPGASSAARWVEVASWTPWSLLGISTANAAENGHFSRGITAALPPGPDETKLDPARLNPLNPITEEQQNMIVQTFNDLETGAYLSKGLPIKVYFNFPSRNTGAQLPTGYKYMEFTVPNPALRHRGAWRLVFGVSENSQGQLPVRLYYTNTHYDSFYRLMLYPGVEGGD